MLPQQNEVCSSAASVSLLPSVICGAHHSTSAAHPISEGQLTLVVELYLRSIHQRAAECAIQNEATKRRFRRGISTGWGGRVLSQNRACFNRLKTRDKTVRSRSCVAVRCCCLQAPFCASRVTGEILPRHANRGGLSSTSMAFQRPGHQRQLVTRSAGTACSSSTRDYQTGRGDLDALLAATTTAAKERSRDATLGAPLALKVALARHWCSGSVRSVHRIVEAIQRRTPRRTERIRSRPTGALCRTNERPLTIITMQRRVGWARPWKASARWLSIAPYPLGIAPVFHMPT